MLPHMKSQLYLLPLRVSIDPGLDAAGIVALTYYCSSFHSHLAAIQHCAALTMTGVLSATVQHAWLCVHAQCHSGHPADTMHPWGGARAEKRSCVDVLFTSGAVWYCCC